MRATAREWGLICSAFVSWRASQTIPHLSYSRKSVDGFSGPKIVAEIYGLTSADQLPQIAENYAPDYFELTAQEFETFHSHLGLPCIVSGPAKADSKIEYALLEESALTSYRGPAKLLVRPTSSDTVLDLIKSSHVAGVALDGTPEVRPGFKGLC